MLARALVLRIDGGSFPDWLAAIGTVGALGFAMWLFAREQYDRRRAQARLVAAWPTTPQPKLSGDGLVFALMVKNGSPEPVYRVRATMVPYDSPHAEDPEAADGRAGTVTARLYILPGGEVLETGLDPARTGVMPGAVGISFTDSQGVRWRRLPSGTLTESRPEAASEPRWVGCAVLWHGPGGS